MSGIAMVCTIVFSMGLSSAGFGQYSITGTGVANTYTQNFDAFTGTLATVPSNWTWSWSDYTPGGYYNRNATYANANSTHALRESSSNTDVSFGGKVDGNIFFLTFTVTNNTGSTINGFELTWDIEQYTRCSNATPVSFSYRLNSGTYGLVNASGSGTTSFTAATGTCGNTASILSTGKALSITSVTLLNGQSADFRFAIGNATSNNAHVGIDNFTIYATAALSTYSIAYNSNGSDSGTVPTDASSPYTSGSTVTVLGNTGSLAKTGYTFVGWTVASDGSGTVLNASNTFSISANTILHAKWTPNNNTITFDGNGATSGSTASQVIPTAGSATLNSNGFSRTGYTFAGWSTTAGGAVAFADGTSYTMGTTDVTLYAVWLAAGTHTVTFNSNGGSGSMANQVSSSTTNLTTNTFTRAGYTFTGWNTASNGSGTSYSNGQSYDFSADLTLFAQWSPINNTLSFNNNGGAGSMASQTVATDASITLPGNTFTRTGYTFSGWNTSADGSGTSYANSASYTMGTSNATLFAVWNANSYTVTFNGNGSDGGSMANQNYVTGTTANLTANAFTRTGYTFSGWNTLADGSGTSYANSASYTMGTANVSLFAQWVVYVGPCLSENFNSGTRPSGWTDSGTGIAYSSNYIDMSVVTGTVTTVSIANPNNLTFNLSRTTNATVKNLNIEVSTTSSSSGFSVVANFDHDNTTSGGTVACTVDLSAFNASSTVYIRFNKTSGSTSPWRIDDVQVFCAAPDPALSVSTTSLTNLNYTVGFGPSAVQTFNLTGTNLDGSDVDLVLANTDFEISSNNTTFSNSINLPAYSGTSQPIYVRLKSGLAVNSYSDVIMIAGGGVALADEPEVSVAGTVSAVITPVITSSLAQTVEYGSSVSYQITANNTPTSFGAINLPTGLSINASGLISGTITANVGTVNTTITATNSAGTDSETLVWTITPKALTVSGLTGSNKVYDGNTTATFSGTGTLNGIVGADAVTLSGTPSVTFANATVENNKSITVSGYTLSGAQAGNYSLTQPTGITANITPKALSVTGATAQDKVYDGNTTASITGGMLVGVVGLDAVTLSGGGTFASANVGTGISVTASFTLIGAQAGNYTLTQPAGLSANIIKANPVFTTSPIAVTVGGTYSLPGSNISSTSDGVLSYTITSGGNATLAGTTITGAVVGSETLTVNQSASANYNAGSTTVVVNVTTFNTGDFRSAGAGNWHSTAGSNDATWEQFNGTSWVSSSAPATNAASLGSRTVYIRDSIYLVGTNTAPNVVVENGGILHTSTVTATFGNLLVRTGGKFYRQANGSGISGTFEVEDNATVYFFHTNTTSRTTSIWAGTEKFHSNSNFIIRSSQNTGGFLIIEANSDISEFNGACFGNLYIDLGAGKMNLIPAGFTKTLANNLYFLKGTENFTITSGTSNLIILNDFVVENSFIYNLGFLSSAATINSSIGGDFIMNASTNLRTLNNSAGTSVVVVSGDVLVNSGTVDINLASGGQSTFNMKGNFTVATGASYTATAFTTAKTIFSGGNVQNVSGAGTINVHNMEVNKIGGYVNLLRNLQAKLQLSMMQGHVYTNTNLFELGENTTNKGTLSYTSGFVNGRMRRWFASTNSNDATGLFPMGQDVSGMKNRFTRVYFTTAPSTGGHLTVEYVTSPMGVAGLPIAAASTGGFGLDVTSTENQGYWKIDNQAGTLTDGAYTISCTGEGFSTINALSGITLLKRVGGGNWFCPGTHVAATGSTAVPTVSRSGVSGWSNFGFGGDAANPLPVELLSFNAGCAETAVELTWSTGSETNSDQFILERSRDVNVWNSVAVVDAAGNSTSQLNYQHTDENPFPGVSYYRLRQIDFNGNERVYGPISVNCSAQGEGIEVYPNPASQQFTVAIALKDDMPATRIQVLDVSGKIIATQVTDLKAGTTNILFDQLDLPAGTYMIHVVSNESHFAPLRLVITN